MAAPRSIVHLDADAFYASVEQATDPRLRGKAMAVGGASRGIIASASYEARKLGVYTPMPTARAKKLCPHLILVPGDFEKYEQFSTWMFSHAFDFTPEVEITGIDEGYFDVTGAGRPAAEIAGTIRDTIERHLKITVSFGLGTSKLVTQIASKLNKPRAFLEVPAGDERKFLDPLPNRWLPGIGPKASARLDSAGLVTIRDVAGASLDRLEELLGGGARDLLQFAQGIDERKLETGETAAKSFSEQETFATDIGDERYLEAVLRRMADNLMRKVREAGKRIRTLTVRVRYRHMDEDQRSESLPEPTDVESEIYDRLGLLLKQARKRADGIRLVGLKLSNIYDNRYPDELPLFESESTANRRALARVVDDLRRNYGRGAIMRGHDLMLRDDGAKGS